MCILLRGGLCGKRKRRERDRREVRRQSPLARISFLVSHSRPPELPTPETRPMVSRSRFFTKGSRPDYLQLCLSIYIPCSYKTLTIPRHYQPSLPHTSLSLPVFRRSRLAPDGWAGRLRRMQNGFDKGPDLFTWFRGGLSINFMCIWIINKRLHDRFFGYKLFPFWGASLRA